MSNQLRIFISTDAGTSLTNVTGSNFSIENTGSRFATSLADPSIVYCCALGNTTPPTLLKSIDGGFTWTVTVLATGTGLGGSSTTVGLGMSNGQGYYDFDIMADPNNADNLIVATTSSYKSTDGGYNFSPLGGYAGGPISMHVDIQCMLATTTDAYISSDGGVLHSTDFPISSQLILSRGRCVSSRQVPRLTHHRRRLLTVLRWRSRRAADRDRRFMLCRPQVEHRNA